MPTATPESAVNKDYLGNEKDVEPEYILLNLKLIDKILMKQMQTSANK